MAKRAISHRATKRIEGKSDKNTLYCSFCGKSQHDVRKLIAGPTVFICDECTDLCADIIYKEGDSKGSVGSADFFDFDVMVDKRISDTDFQLLNLIFENIQNVYPGSKIEILSVNKKQKSTMLRLSFSSAVRLSDGEILSIKEEIRTLERKLRVAQDALLAERGEKEKFENLYRELKDKIFPLLVEKALKDGNITDITMSNLAFMFIDVSGFSQMDDEERRYKVDILMSIAHSVVRSRSPIVLNTWGDAIVAAFNDVTIALNCACRFLRHLEVEGLGARIGVNCGLVRLRPNSVTGRNDFDGDSVNLAARIEPLAEDHEVLCTDDVRFHTDLTQENFIFKEVSRELKKSTGELPKGHVLSLHSVKLSAN